MEIKRELFTLVVVFLMIFLVSCGGSTQETMSVESMEALERPVTPAEFENKRNPVKSSESIMADGKERFAKSCATCHGDSGEGDGPAAAALDPKPENLKEYQRQLSDGYLFWRISEGGAGEPFNSSMPPWKGVLDEEQIWNIIHYIRSLE